jgi:hypothetical protein
MKNVIFIFGILLVSLQTYAIEVVAVKNEKIIREGLTGQSLIDWFTNKQSVQSSDGRYYYPLPDVYYSESCSIIEEAQEEAGAFTDKLFFLFVNKSCIGEGDGKRLVMIIKEVKQGAVEIENLKEILDVEYQLKSDNPRAAILSPALKFYKYTRADTGKTKYFTLIKAARGVSLYSLRNNTNTLMVENAFFRAGEALALFHLMHMDWSTEINPENTGHFTDFYKTVVHGDTHLKNIFYDQATEKVYLIDIESMAYSLKKRYSIAIDFERFYNLPVYRWNMYKGCADKIAIKCTNIDVAYKSFFQGYIQAYPLDKQEYIKVYIDAFIDKYHQLTLLPFNESNREARTKHHLDKNPDLAATESLSSSIIGKLDSIMIY